MFSYRPRTVRQIFHIAGQKKKGGGFFLSAQRFNATRSVVVLECRIGRASVHVRLAFQHAQHVQMVLQLHFYTNMSTFH
jgi:hypothetical protein